MLLTAESRAGLNPDLYDKFIRYHAENPNVYERFEDVALQTAATGFHKYSSKTILEVIRWHVSIETRDADFKINNNFTAYYARLFMQNHPELPGFFETRKRQGEFYDHPRAC